MVTSEAVRDLSVVVPAWNEAESLPELAERMTARISDIKIKYVRIPMTERSEH